MTSKASHPLPKRVCIANFTGERANWGCQATSWELVRILNETFPADGAFQLDTIGLVPHHKLDLELSNQHGTAIKEALSSASPSTGQKSYLLEIARKRYGPHLRKLETADFVIFQGEGTMTGTDFLRAERLLILPWVAQHAFHKPTIWVNQTLFSAQSDYCHTLLGCLRHVARIIVREPATLNWLVHNGVCNATLVPDTAFLVDPLEHGHLAEELDGKGFFCVTGSAALFEEQISAFLDATLQIANETGLMPVFLASTGRDPLLAQRARELWPGDFFTELDSSTPYPAVADLLGRARFILGGRYHLSMMAAISGTPSILLETNTFKNHGLARLLQADWPIRDISSNHDLWTSDALRLSATGEKNRAQLRERIALIRRNIHDGYARWWSAPQAHQPSESSQRKSLTGPAQARRFEVINTQIAQSFVYSQGETDEEMYGQSASILQQLLPLTIYLRRGKRCRASFTCLKQLVEGDLDVTLSQLDTRWLVSICDSYADHGNPIESRNALLVSSFLNWERIAATYCRWSNPNFRTMSVDRTAPENNEPLWDGLITIHLGRGDTLNNLLARYARALRETPVLMAIWRELLTRIRKSDSVLAALGAAHKHLFDENVDYFSDPSINIPRWRRPKHTPV